MSSGDKADHVLSALSINLGVGKTNKKPRIKESERANEIVAKRLSIDIIQPKFITESIQESTKHFVKKRKSLSRKTFVSALH